MRVFSFTPLVVGTAMVLSATMSGEALGQVQPTRPVSDVRIPVRKDARIVRESPGEVALATEVARINTLESTIATLQQRLQTAEAELAALTALPARVEANTASITALEASLRTTREELATARSELAAANARVATLEAHIAQFDRRMNALKYGSIFGHSGFYMGVGTGANFTTGTLHSIGYGTGLNVVVPIGWSKPERLFGVRTELGVQSFEGNVMPGFVNRDPMVYTAVAMLTMNLPINQAKTNFFYLMGGAGAFMFDRIGTASSLDDRLGGNGDRETKFGLTGGAGLEIHVLGATSLFVESAFTNLFADKPANGVDTNRNLRWVPLVAGITLR